MERIPSRLELESWAEKHWDLTLVLADVKQEWAAVTGFYCCYQLMRSALLADPIFDDPAALVRIHPKLLPNHRTATKHSSRGFNTGNFGMIELSSLLYPHVRAIYKSAHDASTGVRYEGCVPRHVPLEVSFKYCNLFRAEYKAGNILHSISQTRASIK